MFDLTLWFTALGALCAVAVGGWLLSLPLRNVSLVDSLWSLKFLLCGLVYAGLSAASGPRAMLLLVLLALWALRLALHITWRNRGHGEDRRYQAIRRNNEPGFAWKSLYIVFGLQAVLAWVISLPLLAAANSSRPLGLLDLLGAGLWLLGFVFEAGGDLQLARFKADPANAGRVMDRGFWRYTRHPNYFGDFCVWWGFYALALSAGGWWSIAGPLLMSALLMKVSGVTLLEKDIGERRPAYADYIRRTPAFFPGRRRVDPSA
jgi:steroid 5-alpha reductase family enzyme